MAGDSTGVRGAMVMLLAASAIAVPAAAQRVSTFSHSVPSVEAEGVAGLPASTVPRIAPVRRTHTGIIIGTAVGLTAGWLIGRSIGDNFNARAMITFGALGAIVGWAFEPRERGAPAPRG